ncbi:hexose kinase [Nocardia sp. NPDC051833]|uniref:hexose kinase n=1 Tax=Nocardia sp. NPDC051833 TaxID=3155674 RepID=UPI00344AA0A9
MILTITANPAYDVTYEVDRFVAGETYRVERVRQRAGGKGVNVSRVLTVLGVPTVATGLASAEFAAEVAGELTADFVPALPWVRRTLVVQQRAPRALTTGLWEPGAPPAADAATALLAKLDRWLPSADVVVVSGSLPPRLGADLPATLARRALAAGKPVICDVSGVALRECARVPGVVLMPNDDELHELTGMRPRIAIEVVGAARAILSTGPRLVIATRGAAGMIAVTATEAWSAAAPRPVSGNTTGAGDAAAAAVAAQLAAGITDLPAVLATAVATSAAAVAAPVAGDIDRELRARLLPEIRARRVGANQENPCL